MDDRTVKSGLRLWRQKQGFTLEEFADLSGLSISMISRLERGQRRLSAVKKVQVARRLNARVRDLFEVER